MYKRQGLILLLLPTGEKEGEAREETEQTQSAFDLAATEARLSQALSKIHGAGEVTVVLTVANGPRQILAENVDRDGSQGEEKTETVVLSRGSGSQETVTVQETVSYTHLCFCCGIPCLCWRPFGM